MRNVIADPEEAQRPEFQIESFLRMKAHPEDLLVVDELVTSPDIDHDRKILEIEQILKKYFAGES